MRYLVKVETNNGHTISVEVNSINGALFNAAGFCHWLTTKEKPESIESVSITTIKGE
jgi:hypothetical protein